MPVTDPYPLRDISMVEIRTRDLMLVVRQTHLSGNEAALNNTQAPINTLISRNMAMVSVFTNHLMMKVHVDFVCRSKYAFL